MDEGCNYSRLEIVLYIFRTARLTNFNTQLYSPSKATWYTDGGRRDKQASIFICPINKTTRISHRRHDLQGQRSRSQGHVISLSRRGQILWSLEAGGGIPSRPDPAATLLDRFAVFLTILVSQVMTHSW